MSDMGKMIRKIKLYLCVMLAVGFVCYEIPDRVSAQDLGNDNGCVETVQEFYEGISSQILAHKERICYYTYSFDIYFNLSDVINAYKYHYCEENPQLSGSYLIYYANSIKYTYWQERDIRGTKYRIQIDIAYEYSEEEMSSFFEQMRQQAESLKCNNDYDSIKAVHDYIIKQVDYDYDYRNYLDYEGFQSGKMVCNGYSMATYLLLADMGIPVRIITGTAYDSKDNEVGHSWNLVQLDGNWYNMDATWDDLGGKKRSYTYFLKGSMDFENHVCDVELQGECEKLISKTSYELPFMDALKEDFKHLLFGNSQIFISLFAVCGYMISRGIRNYKQNKENLSK